MSNPAGAVTSEDGSSRYYPYPPTQEPLDSTTAIISGTHAEPWIPPWYGKVATEWCVDNLSVIARLKKSQGRDAAIKLGKDQAKLLREVKADVGTFVHDVQQALILSTAGGCPLPVPDIPEHLQGALYHVGGDEFEQVEKVIEYMTDGFLNWVSAFNPKFLAAEMTVYNYELGYAGTLDIIAEITGYAISIGTGLRGEDEIVACPGNVLRLCIDTKTGKSPAGKWKDQLAAYRRATECGLPMNEVRPMLRTDAGAVLHLRPDYPEGFLLMLVSASNDELAWERFKARAHIYREQREVRDKPGAVIRPLRPDGTMPAARLCDLAAEGYGHALAPLRKAFGADAEITGLAEFSEAELIAVKGIGEKTVEAARRMLTDHRIPLGRLTPGTDTSEAFEALGKVA